MSGVRGWPAVVFTLQRAPHTATELAAITGLHSNGVRTTLRLLENEGLATRQLAVTRVGKGRNADVWQWEPDA